MEGGWQLKQMHFSPDEWQDYKRKTIEPELMAEIETHLELCEDCQEYFLSLIDEADIEAAQDRISLDFTDNLIKKINKHTPASIPAKIQPGRRKLNRRDLFAYYVTAAVITLALMSGGIFDSMVEKSMYFSQICVLNSQRIESTVSQDWDDQLMKDSSKIIQSFSINKERNVKDAKQK